MPYILNFTNQSDIDGTRDFSNGNRWSSETEFEKYCREKGVDSWCKNSRSEFSNQLNLVVGHKSNVSRAGFSSNDYQESNASQIGFLSSDHYQSNAINGRARFLSSDH